MVWCASYFGRIHSRRTDSDHPNAVWARNSDRISPVDFVNWTNSIMLCEVMRSRTWDTRWPMTASALQYFQLQIIGELLGFFFWESFGSKVICDLSSVHFSDTMGNKGAFITLNGKDMKPQYTTYEAVVCVLMIFFFFTSISPLCCFFPAPSQCKTNGICQLLDEHDHVKF